MAGARRPGPCPCLRRDGAGETEPREFQQTLLRLGHAPDLAPQPDLAEEAPNAEIAIDLASQTVALPGGQAVSFPIDGFSKTCLLNGVDELGYIQSFSDQIAAYEAQHGIAMIR